ncbi:NAD-dependent epimerase/dehydratase family protein [Microbacterium immunditiarum]|uniref:Nucleoside-diphosphate-sugar epimerase n=1 Tax=Microbacterium immunditiarum TaxID=337480 RepID=A0A7Y9KM93_9MICO|nr:NAD-dependent epimerase/dehydratase family protein [Microbacterium immunditiarum]NYE21038.1 nucleoside-diphosphate-sugar epimerase [Microbacterium immunditiarum]
MKSALIGYTGFVGTNIHAVQPFDDLYNSSNIGDIAGREYDLVVSAGNRADSHRINTHGAEDRREIDGLVDLVLQARIRKLVLISTVCVYPEGGSPDEGTPLTEDGLTPYGVNRLHQERRLAASVDTTIVRLPQLYGNGLKKGVVYDLLNDYRVEYIRPQTEFQHYDVRRLWRDISTALDAGLESFNVATPPIANEDLAREVFGRDIADQEPLTPESPFAQMYTRNMTTRHAELFAGSGPYLLSREDELAGLKAFVAEARSDQTRRRG